MEAKERYTPTEKTLIKTTLQQLQGRKKTCVVSFIKGYEVYTYPHCMQYRKDKAFCNQYKGSVPTSVVDTAFDICDVEGAASDNGL
ncbi:hypothetical protein [Oceanicoccus sagamiensis]|uniref:Uncharacterized protein n=1 Tax=Oceanicoccus sagamiensis TaxID=716816 RepID=A0A1X9NER3_9GAMM|nr:hypothetical protein [Oceanicoccus sagamiensis]ARN74039.1 hypothetical protein BST96_07850 [Oceanicoccus sagamiensis]